MRRYLLALCLLSCRHQEAGPQDREPRLALLDYLQAIGTKVPKELRP